MFEVDGLQITYGKTEVVHRVSFGVKPGEIIGIVGESGSGKSTMLKGILGILDNPGQVTGGQIRYEGTDLLGLPRNRLRQLCGNELAMLSQHPELSLDPLWKTGKTYYETVRAHRKITKGQAEREAVEIMRLLRLENPERILNSYPFELSGGMCQRVALAIAIANRPRLLLADEPTSALDVTVQKQVIDTMLDLRKQFGTAIVIVSHNMGVIAAMADKVGVIEKGRTGGMGKPGTGSLSSGVPLYTEANQGNSQNGQEVAYAGIYSDSRAFEKGFPRP